jgi:hypothetical protein
VAEVNLVRPFDRPAKNWIWELNLQPGFYQLSAISYQLSEVPASGSSAGLGTSDN